ncbi:MAG TPA: response regulator [Solirubrobacteraceae bacterium]|nr:response regulator [Solirubrobacteraceae bacterium]
MAVGTLEDEAGEPSAEWREACAVDDAYCEWLFASADDRPAAFAAYRAALDQEESVAAIDRAVIDRLGRAGPEQGVPSGARSQEVRILVVDGDGFARRMLQRVLGEAAEVGSVIGACDGREALEQVRGNVPDLLLVDIGVPPAGGIELIRVLVGMLPRIRVVTVSTSADWDAAVLAAIRAGAVGHIDKDAAPDQIARLAVLAAVGEAVVPGRLMTRLLASPRMAAPAAEDRGAVA